jgi:hypothetical protein
LVAAVTLQGQVFSERLPVIRRPACLKMFSNFRWEASVIKNEACFIALNPEFVLGSDIFALLKYGIVVAIVNRLVYYLD